MVNLSACFLRHLLSKSTNQQTNKSANPITRTGFTPLEKMRFSRERGSLTGFTFVEILLVVVIIGILASMILPRFVGRSEQARQAAARADINASIATALDMFELDNGQYPDKLDDLIVTPSSAINWNGPYLKKKPTDPWGREYIYKLTADKKDYELVSYGKDGVAGGVDDISNREVSDSSRE
ncbi:MAG: type II secretion system major pseudopilin GspG [Candidatus Omnitrophota bacterium]